MCWNHHCTGIQYSMSEFLFNVILQSTESDVGVCTTLHVQMADVRSTRHAQSLVFYTWRGLH